MTTQTLEFDYVAGQSLVGKLFPIDSDTQVGADASCTEATNRDGLYSCAFTDVPAGQYKLRVYLGGVFAASFVYSLTLTTGVFREVFPTPSVSVTIPAAVATASQTPGLITAIKSSRLSVDLPVMGTITGYTKADWMVKRNLDDDDSESLIHVRAGVGLVRLNGTAATDAALASLMVTDASTGAATLVLAAALTAQLKLLDGLYWATKIWDASGYPSEPISGRFGVSPGVVQATA